MRLRHRRERCDRLAANIVLRKAIVHQSWGNARRHLEYLLTSSPVVIALGAAAGALLVNQPWRLRQLLTNWPLISQALKDMVLTARPDLAAVSRKNES